MAPKLNDRVDALETSVQTMQALLAIKDEQLQLLKTVNQLLENTNQSLNERVTRRWDLLKLGYTVLALLFVVAIGDQFMKGSRLSDVITQAQESNTRLDSLFSDVQHAVSESEHLRSTTVIVANNFSTVAQSISDLTMGYAEYSQDNIEIAAVLAKSVQERLTDSKQQLPPDSSFRRPIDSMLASALSLSAMCAFRERKYEHLGPIADELIRVDPNRWEGYHYRALHEWMPTERSPDKVVYYLKKSIEAEPRGNRDYLNLAEYYLVAGNYDLVRDNARDYLNTCGAYVNQYALLGAFFLAVGAYISDPSQSHVIDEFLATLEGTGKYARVQMAGKFDESLVERLRAKIKEEGKLGEVDETNEVAHLLTAFDTIIERAKR